MYCFSAFNILLFSMVLLKSFSHFKPVNSFFFWSCDIYIFFGFFCNCHRIHSKAVAYVDIMTETEIENDVQQIFRLHFFQNTFVVENIFQDYKSVYFSQKLWVRKWTRMQVKHLMLHIGFEWNGLWNLVQKRVALINSLHIFKNKLLTSVIVQVAVEMWL